MVLLHEQSDAGDAAQAIDEALSSVNKLENTLADEKRLTEERKIAHASEVTTLLPEELLPEDVLEMIDVQQDGCVSLGGEVNGPAAVTLLMDIVKTNTTVTSLDLYGCAAGAEGGKAIAAALVENAALTTLELGANELGAEGSAAIARALEANTALTSLDLDGNHIGDAGGLAIAAALGTNTALQSLSLARNAIKGEAAEALAVAAMGSVSLQHLSGLPIRALEASLQAEPALDVSGTYLGSVGGLVLGGLLQASRPPMLTSLDASGTMLGAEGGSTLVEALASCPALTALSLGDTMLGAEGGKAVAARLGEHATLATLNLRHNELGAAGGVAVAAALAHNAPPALTSLDLAYNRLGDAGGGAIAASLTLHTTLASLRLDNNAIEAWGGKAFAEALAAPESATSLTALALGFNRLDDDAKAAVRSAVASREGFELEL